MSFFTDRFTKHPVHAAIGTLLEELAAYPHSDANNQHSNAADRTRIVVEFTKRTLDAVDPELTTLESLNNLKNHVDDLHNHYRQFQNETSWKLLNAPADALLHQLHLLPRFDIPDQSRIYSETVNVLKDRGESAIQRVEGACIELENRMSGFQKQTAEFGVFVEQHKAALDQQKQRLDKMIAELQSHYTAAEQSRTTAFGQGEQARLREFADSQRSRQESADKAGKEIYARANTILGEIERNGHAVVQGLGDRAATMHKENTAIAQGMREALERDQQRVAEIVGIVSNSGMTGHYIKVADVEKYYADLFRWITVGFMVVLIGIVVWVVLSINSNEFRWEIGLFRVAVALGCLAPAIYCAKESTAHRRSEGRNRRIALELASISAYLEILPKEKAQAVIEQLAPRYFGQDNAEVDDEALQKLKNLRLDDFLTVAERVSKITNPPQG